MLKYLKNFLAIFYLALVLISCTGDDGVDGLDGENGVPGATGPRGLEGATGPQGPQGNPGLPGTNGNDGANGAGFDELTKNGTITQRVIGTTNSALPFNTLFTYKLLYTSGLYAADSYTVNNSTKEFTIQRFYAIPLIDYYEPSIEISLNIIDDQPKLIYFYSGDIKFKLSTNKTIWHRAEFDEEELASVASVSNYSYNSDTNRLYFDYSINVNQASIGYYFNKITSISGTVDVILELIDLEN